MRQSAGILLFRRRAGQLEVLLLHPAGPLWAHKNCWHLPAGETDPGESLLEAARREFREEVGAPLPAGELIPLGETRRPGKTSSVWALEADADLNGFEATLTTNTFTMEWPPKSGRRQTYPENDRAEWFPLEEAYRIVFGYVTVFFDRLCGHLGLSVPTGNGESDQQSLL